ncbi:zinc-binding dehydrogenase [Pelobium sp.]|nr:zinc-binding dehydrogenase [Pelobium sp.]MDA9554957.1 zinc-binding dehydrogenase [Pelobium sp.]
MKALVLKGIDQPLLVEEVEKPILQAGEALVKIKAAAFNRRDFWISKGRYAGLKFPITLGSDGAGIVAEVFSDEDNHWLNQEVVINPSNNWGSNPNFQGPDFKILGLPDDGTFAEYVKVKVANLYNKPNHLDFMHAAAFPLAGLTAYRALFTKAKLTSNDTVLIVGVGGGAALFALQWAVNFGAKVYVTSSSDEKINKAIELGAKCGVNYKEENWDLKLKELSGGIDVIIDSAVGPSFDKHFTYINAGARIVFFGATAGDMPALNARAIFWKQIQILGTTMGTSTEFEAMLNFINQHKITPIVEHTFNYKDANEALALMEYSTQFGKIVLEF